MSTSICWEPTCDGFVSCPGGVKDSHPFKTMVEIGEKHRLQFAARLGKGYSLCYMSVKIFPKYHFKFQVIVLTLLKKYSNCAPRFIMLLWCAFSFGWIGVVEIVLPFLTHGSLFRNFTLVIKEVPGVCGASKC